MNVFHEIRYWWQRRIRSGWDDRDMWDINLMISRWLPQRIREFRANTSGYPGGLTWDQWMAILDEMADDFEFYVQHHVDLYGGREEAQQRIARAYINLRFWHAAMWD